MDSRGRPRVQTVFEDESLTVQSDGELTDLNRMMERYKNTGLLDALNKTEAQFMDCTQFSDYADLMRNVKEAEAEFMKLPSKVREIFDHDVVVWLDSAHDKEKRDALVQAGYLKMPEVAPAEAPPGVEEGGDD